MGSIDEPGDMIFRQDVVNGVRSTYLIKTPPRYVLIDQGMLTSAAGTFTVKDNGHLEIKCDNAKVVYKLAQKQLQGNAMTFERVTFQFKEPPPPPTDAHMLNQPPN